MNKYEITQKIEKFAPLETQEPWDCSGWLVDVKGYDEINKIMLCLTVTEGTIKQAKEQNCDMIISHHPLFYVPLTYQGINIYCAHTNLDKAKGGTTDTLIVELGLCKYKLKTDHEFLRIIEYKTSINEFNKIIKKINPNSRIVNNGSVTEIKRIAFCSGSGGEFIETAKEYGADCLVTGDLKFHSALDSEIVLYDIGHFESEIIILPVLGQLLENRVEIVYGAEKSPFRQI